MQKTSRYQNNKIQVIAYLAQCPTNYYITHSYPVTMNQ